jgi:hypothetical protein
MRYNITNASDKIDALRKTAEHLADGQSHPSDSHFFQVSVGPLETTRAGFIG